MGVLKNFIKRLRSRDGPVGKILYRFCSAVLIYDEPKEKGRPPDETESLVKEPGIPYKNETVNAETVEEFHYNPERKLESTSESLPIKIPLSEIDTAISKVSTEKGEDISQKELSETAVKRVPPILPKSRNEKEVYQQLKCENVKDKQVPVKDICNIEVILETDDRFAGKIAYNEFTGLSVIRGDVAWNVDRSKFRELTDTDVAAILSILQRAYGISNKSNLDSAIELVVNRHHFNPLVDLLESCKWDGQSGHIRKLLPFYLGAEDSDYTFQVMRLMMVAAVKRIYEPGTKFDFVVVLQSQRQGIGKSSFVRRLALKDEYFSDSLVSLDGDETAKSLLGVWFVELAELKAIQMTRGGDEAVKQFISATQDRLRLPYEKNFRTYPRQFIMVGTVNSFDFLGDITGNRRYLIIECAKIEPHTKELFSKAAGDDIKAAWAEAVHIYKTENPELDDLPEEYRIEAEELRKKHTADDGAKGRIFEYLKNKDKTCSLEIWEEVFHQKKEMTIKDSKIITDLILSDPDWEHTTPQSYGKYGKQRIFRRKTKLM